MTPAETAEELVKSHFEGNPMDTGYRNAVVAIAEAIESAVKAEREECAKLSDYWGKGNWKVQVKNRSRFSIYDLQFHVNTTGRGISEDIRNRGGDNDTRTA